MMGSLPPPFTSNNTFLFQKVLLLYNIRADAVRLNPLVVGFATYIFEIHVFCSFKFLLPRANNIFLFKAANLIM